MLTNLVDDDMKRIKMIKLKRIVSIIVALINKINITFMVVCAKIN